MKVMQIIKVIDYFMHEKKNLSTLNKIAVTALISGDNGKSKSILITGTERDVGTTYITTNLAMSYAKIGNKVLVIDSNYKNGIQNKIFNINSKFGLSELVYIVNENNNEYINFKDYIQKSPIDGINVISYGEHQINEKLLISDKTIKLFKLLENEYDIILIDASPISKDMVPLILSNFTDSTIVVAQQNKTKMEDIKESKQTLKNINKNIAGVILNRVEE